MIQLRVWAARVHGLVFRRRHEADLAEEVRVHLELQVEDNLRAGMSADEARHAALRSFGGVEQMHEEHRDRRGVPVLETLWRDLRHATRSLLRAPGFTLIALVTFALGIGAGTAVFSVVNAVLLRSLAVPNPQDLRVLRWTGTHDHVPSLAEKPIVNGARRSAYSFPHPLFVSLRQQAAAQADVFGFIPIADVAVRAQGAAFAASGLMVSDNFFDGLAVQPVVGHLFTTGDDAAGATNVVITSAWWERHFARSPDALGQTVMLNGAPFNVIGVLPPAFAGVQSGERCEFYVLMSARPQFFKEPFQTFGSNRHWWVRLMARLKPTAHDTELGAMLTTAFAGQAVEFMQEPAILLEPGRAGLAGDRARYSRSLLLMLGVVGMVMLVACANLAGLSVARATARQHEWAVRVAIGAGRLALIRASLMESILIALVGGALGCLLALWGRTAISRLLAGSQDGLHYDLSLDLTVLGFSLALALATALLAGLLPALRAARVDPIGALKSRRGVGAPQQRIGKGLVVAQVSLSLSLLACAGLYLRTLVNLGRIDAGFPTEGLLLFEVNPASLGYQSAELSAFNERLQGALAALPGVQAASVVQYPPLDDKYWRVWFSLPGHTPKPPGELQTYRLIVGDTFFDTMGIPILQGRALGPADDEGSTKVVVVNETFARKHLPNEEPLGQSVKIFGVDWQIVGVSRDAKYENVKAPVAETVYNSFRQYSIRSSICFAVRTTLPPLALSQSVRQTVSAIDPAVPIIRLVTQAQLRDANVSQERLLATLCGALAGLALLLSCIGLYGLMAYQVTRRTNEIAIRMAIGAQPEQVARSILREALILVGLGIGIGLPAAVAISRLIKSQLFGVGPDDPATLAAVVTALLTVTLLGAWLPARRATHVSPLTALRSD